VFFLLLDVLLVAGCAIKFMDGGWFPLLLGVVLFLFMTTWRRGRELLLESVRRDGVSLEAFIAQLDPRSVNRAERTAVYPVADPDTVPQALLHNLKHNQVLHQQVILLHVATTDEPHAIGPETIAHEDLGEGVHRITLRFGFADTPDVPQALRQPLPEGLKFNPAKATYFLGRETYGVGQNAGLLDRARLFLFAVMARNASPATAYFKLPPGRVVELGSQITL
jgi:KUP system potassium uptake protein